MKPNSLFQIALLPLFAIALGASIAAAPAAKFDRAEVTKIVNDVKLVSGTKTTRPASRGSVIRGETAVRTGQKSRAELQFPDESIVRLGSNSLFSFLEGKREIDLKNGTLLLQVPKSLGRTKVKTAAISAAITGTTILIEFIPPALDDSGRVIKHGTVKIIVIEGSLEFSLTSDPRKVLKLGAGDMVALRTDAKQLPQKFKIDLDRLVRTSLLMDGGLGPLPRLEPVDEELAGQGESKLGGRLLAKNAQRDAGGSGLLARLFSGRPINRARDVINRRPPDRPEVPVIRRGGSNNNGGGGGSGRPPNNRPPVNLPDRPDRDPPGGGPGNSPINN